MEEVPIFYWMLFLCLVGVCLPGVTVAIPQLLNSIEQTIVSRLPAGKKVPPKPFLIILLIARSLILVAIDAV